MMAKLFMEHLTLMVMLLEVGKDVLFYGKERRKKSTVQNERNAETEHTLKVVRYSYF